MSVKMVWVIEGSFIGGGGPVDFVPRIGETVKLRHTATDAIQQFVVSDIHHQFIGSDQSVEVYLKRKEP